MPTGIYKRTEKHKVGQFKKGMIPWIAGKKHTKSTRMKISKALTGNYLGEQSPNWKGGRRIDARGYIVVYNPNHPKAHNSCVYEHRLVIEKKIGRYLLPQEQVHHINGIKIDNRIKNLKLFKNDIEHKIYETRNKILNPAKVKEIRILLKSKSKQEIATMYGVTTGAVGAILHNKAWKWVK